MMISPRQRTNCSSGWTVMGRNVARLLRTSVSAKPAPFRRADDVNDAAKGPTLRRPEPRARDGGRGRTARSGGGPWIWLSLLGPVLTVGGATVALPETAFNLLAI